MIYRSTSAQSEKGIETRKKKWGQLNIVVGLVWLNVQSIHASSLAMLNFRAAENHCAFVHDLAVVAVAPSSSTPTTSRLEDDIFFNQTFVQKNSGLPLC